MANGKDIAKLTAAAAGVFILKSVWNQLTEFDLKDKTVLITGGSRGLGLVLAREFARHGAQIALCARDQAEVDRALDELGEQGVSAAGLACDVGDRAQVERMVDALRLYFGRIDVLVNNAGVIQVGPMETMTLADYEEAMRTHYWGPVYTTLAVLPEMKKRQDGRVVNITSIGGKVSVPHLLPYCASKF